MFLSTSIEVILSHARCTLNSQKPWGRMNSVGENSPFYDRFFQLKKRSCLNRLTHIFEAVPKKLGYFKTYSIYQKKNIFVYESFLQFYKVFIRNSTQCQGFFLYSLYFSALLLQVRKYLLYKILFNRILLK